MKISECINPPDVKGGVSEEVMAQLSEEDMSFLNGHRLVQIEHKCHNFEPILIDEDLQKTINLLLEYRPYAEVERENPYVFAAGKGSLQPARGSQIMN